MLSWSCWVGILVLERVFFIWLFSTVLLLLFTTLACFVQLCNCLGCQSPRGHCHAVESTFGWRIALPRTWSFVRKGLCASRWRWSHLFLANSRLLDPADNFPRRLQWVVVPNPRVQVSLKFSPWTYWERSSALNSPRFPQRELYPQLDWNIWGYKLRRTLYFWNVTSFSWWWGIPFIDTELLWILLACSGTFRIVQELSHTSRGHL